MKIKQFKRLTAVAVLAGFLGIGVIGCGGGKDKPTSVALRPPKVQSQEGQGGGGQVESNNQGNGGGETPSNAGGGIGKIMGQIIIRSEDAGSLPKPELVMFAEGKAPVDSGYCAAKTPIFDESFIVNPMNRGVENVFIYLEEMPDGGKKEIESQSDWPGADGEGLVLDQQNCTYKPHAMIVIAGKEFKANSQDLVVHSYRGTPVKNSIFNETIPSNGTLQVMPYRRPEKYPVPISCSTHSWMSGYQLPLDHPYADVTDRDGKFVISDLPAGEHKFIIWHEKKGNGSKGVIAEQTITVKAGDNDLGEITFRLNQFK